MAGMVGADSWELDAASEKEQNIRWCNRFLN